MYRFHDGEYFIYFHLLGCTDTEVRCAVQRAGKITVQNFDLLGEEDEEYFEYGLMCNKIFIEDFD